MKRTTVIISMLLVTSLIAMAAPGGASTVVMDNSTNETYAGAHVEFDVESDTIANYSVGGTETVSDVSVQSQSETDVGIGAGLSTVADIDGAGLSMSAESETSATVEAESGATLAAHDTDRGHLIVSAGDDDQYVEAELGSDVSASTDGDVVVVDDGEREGAFVVVGDGEVDVNENGDVAAALEGGAELVYRSYASGERDDEATAEESMIAAGEAAVELYVEEREDGVVSEAVTFGEETSAEASAEAENRVEMTVERSVEEGTIVLTTVSKAVIDSADDLEVAVDGETATEASSQSELEAGADGEEPRYMVASQTEAEASVYVAIDHFSERNVEMAGADDSDTGDDADTADDSVDDSDTADDSGDAGDDDPLPGFGALVALVSVLLAVGIRFRSH